MQEGTTRGSTTPPQADAPHGVSDDHVYSLEELAAAAGMTARNVRAYQTRKLLPKPSRVGRRSAYTGAHLARLLAVQRARGQGASLELIAGYLATGGGLTEDGLPAAAWLRDPEPAPGPPAWLPLLPPAPRSAADGAPVAARDPRRDPTVRPVVDALVALRLVRDEDGVMTAPPPLARASRTLAEAGVPLTGSLTVALRAAEAATTLAKVLREIVVELDATGPEHRSGVCDLATGVVGLVLDDALTPDPVP